MLTDEGNDLKKESQEGDQVDEAQAAVEQPDDERHRCGEHKQEAQQDHVWFTIPFVRRSAGILNRDTRGGSSSRSFLVSTLGSVLPPTTEA